MMVKCISINWYFNFFLTVILAAAVLLNGLNIFLPANGNPGVCVVVSSHQVSPGEMYAGLERVKQAGILLH